MLADVLAEIGSDWEADGEDLLVTCCGDALELDGDACPTCGTKNPLKERGII